MRIKVLGASGSEVPGRNCPAFLVDETFLLDAGTIGDHIKGIPFLLDNLVIRNTGNTITVMSGKEVIDDLRKNSCRQEGNFYV